jgi:hypothetical protein
LRDCAVSNEIREAVTSPVDRPMSGETRHRRAISCGSVV